MRLYKLLKDYATPRGTAKAGTILPLDSYGLKIETSEEDYFYIPHNEVMRYTDWFEWINQPIVKVEQPACNTLVITIENYIAERPESLDDIKQFIERSFS